MCCSQQRRSYQPGSWRQLALSTPVPNRPPRRERLWRGLRAQGCAEGAQFSVLMATTSPDAARARVPGLRGTASPLGCRADRARNPRQSRVSQPTAALSLSLRHGTGHQEFPCMSCCNRSADHSGGDHNWHRCRLCHMRLCHPGRRASTDWKGVMTFGQAPQNSRGGCCSHGYRIASLE